MDKATSSNQDNNNLDEVKDAVKAADPGARVTPRFVCTVCGNNFEDQELLKKHIDELHEQKRTVTATEIIRKIFDGSINLPKTKAEIVKYVEENKDKPSVIPDIVDALRNIPDRLYNNEADLILGLRQQRGESATI